MIDTLRLLLLLLTAASAAAADSGEIPGFGGPGAVENQIDTDATPSPALIKDRMLQPWFEWKASFQEQTGFSFGLDLYRPLSGG